MEANQKNPPTFQRITYIWVGLIITSALTPIGVSGDEWLYVTRPGDNLWNITQKYLKGIEYWRPLQALNKISRPRYIPPGTQLRIPVAWSKAQAASAKILAAEGKVDVRQMRTGENNNVSVGQLLRWGDEIFTRQNSNVLLEFTDGTRLLLLGGSHLIINKLDAFGAGDASNTEINIDKGRAEIHANPKKRTGSRFNITTPSALTSVRGTDFRLAANNSLRESRFEVTLGRITVSNAGISIMLNQGYGTLTQKGMPPTPPSKLLPPPNTAGIPSVFEQKPFSFKLTPLAGAANYRLQIAGDEKFDILLYNQRFPDQNITMSRTDLPDGDYAMRIRGIDNRGIEGYDAISRFTLNAQPVPPFLMEPKADAAVITQQPRFRWARPEQARSYHLQLAANDRFEQPLLDQAGLISEGFSPDQPLMPGRYYWRVTANDAKENPGPMGHPQRFRILPPASSTNMVASVEQKMAFHWTPGKPGQRYRFQVSKSKEFSNPQVDEILNDPYYDLPQPEPGIYYMRVQTLTTNGVVSPFGALQSVTVPEPDRSWFAMLPLSLLLLLAL